MLLTSRFLWGLLDITTITLLLVFVGWIYCSDDLILIVVGRFWFSMIFMAQKRSILVICLTSNLPPQKKTPHTSMTQKAKDVITQ